MKNIILTLLIISSINLTISALDLSKYYFKYIKIIGYKLVVHEVQTDDDYILSLWHLVPKKPTTKVAYFQHGLFDTAWCFFQLGANSLPFLLMKEGFDVWLGNSRGNIFSLKHTSKDPYDEKSGFFDFCMDDLVKYDLPATIRYIKEKTGVKTMSYIGHSQGTTIFIMLYMHNPSLVESSFDHFSSVGTVPNIAYATASPLKIIDCFYKFLEHLNIEKVKGSGILNLDDDTRLKIAVFCKKFPNVCKYFLDQSSAIKPTGKINHNIYYKLLFYFPGGSSNKILLHWSQIRSQKKLVYFNPNYDEEKTATPYDTKNLRKWKVKSLVARTDMDTLSSYKDVTEFKNLVNNDSILKILDIKNYGHRDVLMANCALNEVFKPIVKFLKE